MTAARRAKSELLPIHGVPAAQFRETGEMGQWLIAKPWMLCPSPIYPSKDGPWGHRDHETQLFFAPWQI